VTDTPSPELSPLKRALLAVERLQRRVRELEQERRQPLAVVGMACRFPAGDGPDAFWAALRRGEDAVRERPPIDRPGFPSGDAAFPFPPAGYLPDDITAFDPAFFGISPREASSIDPQQRLLLEVAWEALEDAGIDPRHLEGSRTGVFVGMAGNDYAQIQLSSERAQELLGSHFASGIGHSMASGRISYLLGLQGPAITVDTACSSSLVATHLACQSLRVGESDLALAAGANLILSNDFTIAFQRSRMLAPDGRCKSFDASADGFGRGEGCGVVVLRRLDDALRDGDRILALVRGSAVNQDGPSSGLTAPSGPAQEAVIRQALDHAGLTPDDIGYVEAHGTGTSLGDPIEAQALGAVFGPRDESLAIGSVKANMGHLEAAAGIAGLIKVVQSLRAGEIAPHPHLSAPSPHIPWASLPLTVPTAITPFPRRGGRRRASISSFGFSGTNAHVVLEEAPEVSSPGEVEGSPPGSPPVRLVPISTPSGTGLSELARRWAAHLRRTEDGFDDVAHTAGVGRAHFSHRLALVATDAAAAAGALERWSAGEKAPEVRTGSRRRADRPHLAFLYTGQGAQYPGMGHELYRVNRVFRSAIDRCEEILGDRLEVPLTELLDPDGQRAELIHRTDLTQPALFAVQYALTEVWTSWGVRPSVVLGHSIGEFAAAYVAGAFSLEDALHLVVARGRAMHAVHREGRMLAVMAPEARVGEWVEQVGGDLSIAAVNAPTQVVVSGATERVAEVEALASAAAVTTRTLRTSHAFHSPLMEGALPEMEAALSGIELTPADRVRFISTVTGRAVRPAELADPAYWVGQIRSPVRFADAVTAAAGIAERAVEIGPHPALSGLVAQSETELPVHPSLHRERGAWETLLGSVGDLYVAGTDPDWRALPDDAPRRRVPLPARPFQRVRLWVDTGEGRRADDLDTHPLLGSERPRPGRGRDFQRTLRADAPAFIGEHRVMGRILLPGTGFVEMALAAAERVLGQAPGLGELDFVAPLLFDGGARRVHTSVEPRSRGIARIEIHSAAVGDGPEAEWTLHASGTLVGGEASPSARVDLDAIRARCADVADVGDLYRSMAARGFDLGPRFHTLTELHLGEHECLTRIRLPGEVADDPGGYVVHPLLLDAALQSVGPALDPGAGRSFLPIGVERVRVSGAPFTEAWVHARIVHRGERTAGAELRLLDDTGAELAGLSEVRFREVSADDLASASDTELLRVRWVPAHAAPVAPTSAPDTRGEVVDRLEATLRREAELEDAAAYDDFVGRLESRSGTWVAHAFATMGWTPVEGSHVELEALADELGVVPERLRLLRRCLDILVEEKFLEAVETGWRVLRAPVTALPAQVESDEESAPELVLLERCGPYLADGLRGRVDPLELLFPGGDSSLAERMYHDAPAARIFGRSVADAVEAVLRRTPVGRPLRILEIGAGTGGTTRRVVQALTDTDAPTAAEYHVTDVSGLFVERARRRFAEAPWVRFHTFDLDRPPAEQDVEIGSFDLIVAANCIHAARDLTGAVRGIAELLRPGGLLVAVEVFAPHRWFDLTVGLTDGWWHFTDAELRGSYPCVSPDTWRDVLNGAGFEEIRVIPLADVSDADGIASTGQGLVVAVRGASRLDGPWLVVGRAGGLAEAVAARLGAQGAEPVIHEPTKRGEEAATEVMRVVGSRDRWSGVLYCAAGSPSLDLDEMRARLGRDAGTLLGIARTLTGGGASVGQVRLVTRGGRHVDAHDADLDPAGAALHGFVRSLRLEATDLPVGTLDLDPAHDPVRSPDTVDMVLQWLAAPLTDPDLAVRRGAPMAPRLVTAIDPVAPASLPDDYRLGPPSSGSIDDLAFVEGERVAPGPGQVEIRVAASALNFKDVLNVLGMYPGDPGPLGSECSGVVTAVGEGVDLEPGTPVVAAAGHAYGKHVLAEATLVAPRPAGLSFAEAATLPVAYLTAHFALNHLGRLGPGDRVLIHAAAGGVGSAACALAARTGAEVFATAGSEVKRELLRARGIRHVFDSRSDSFVAGVMDATDGAGVTVVLNSLADHLVDRSFEVVATGGRFLEIGKRGIWSQEQVDALGREIEYHVIDWGRTHDEDPEGVGALFHEVMAWIGDGSLTPLPSTVFPLEEATDAFRYMANARHVGKIVLGHPVAAPEPRIEKLERGTVLVTGGRSGLGFETVRWLAERGARSLVAISRSEPDEVTRGRFEELRRAAPDGQVEIHLRRCDVGDAAEVEQLITWIEGSLPPLAGVVHSAGSLSDRTLARATWSDFEAVFRAKVEGSLHLAAATRGAPSPLFLGYSSIAAVLGSPGQANHAAANAFMDHFAATLWSRGSDGASIAWGPWSETGSATDAGTLARTRDLGIGALTTEQGLDLLARFFEAPCSNPVAMRLVDPRALARGRSGSLLDELAGFDGSTSTPADEPAAVDGEGGERLPALLDRTPVGARRGVLARRVRDRVRSVLGMDADTDLDPERPLGELGLDSLLAVELKNVLGADVDMRLPATLLFDYPTLAALTDHLLDLLSPTEDPGRADRSSAVAEGADASEAVGDPLGAVESLSDDEVDRLLSEQFERNE
jgi:acyl transferase domain-containing protein/NADPH:quinone reductase-like Zn-dependent oxidoreductase/SAM-dependent methyltransferase/acyl carrier protein